MMTGIGKRFIRDLQNQYVKAPSHYIFLTPKICELIPDSIKSIDLLPAFNIAIKQRKLNPF